MQEEKFWIVWNSGPMGRIPVMKHPTPEAAQAEAERLAGLHNGIKFWVLEAIGYMRVPIKSNWTSVREPNPFEEEIPF